MTYDPTPLVEAANVPEHPTYAHDQEMAREAFLAMGKGADSITSHLMRLIGRVRVETQVQLQRDAAAKDAEIARLEKQAQEVTAALEIASQFHGSNRCQVFIQAFVEEREWAVADVAKHLAALREPRA